MKLTPVIAALRARCPYFENRVAGAAQFKNLPEVGKLRLPAAYVVPGDDSPGENKSQTDYWQELKEGFSVVVILSNGRDERGQFASYDVVDDIRQMLFKAILGWNPEACGNPITYDGGTLLDLNRHELIYQFDFSVISELTEDDNGGVPSTGGINIIGGNGGDGQSGNIGVSGEGGTSYWGAVDAQALAVVLVVRYMVQVAVAHTMPVIAEPV